MNSILIKANTRGHAYHGWLDTYHTFSFANYYDPQRIHFGALRVLNDDVVIGGEGFEKHPHDNMEIITIPLKGGVKHGDSMGNGGIIREGDVQVMSAGTGVTHSEYNADSKQSVNFFQIWVFPNKKNVVPRYEQKKMTFLQNRNTLNEIVTPEPTEYALWIYQQAWFNIGSFDTNKEVEYKLHNLENGLFAMVIQGEFEVGDIRIENRDGLALWGTTEIKIKSLNDDARILLIEVPMTW
ncbi:MAG: pirin family protein [Bacteroidales bacterium]|jgi:redox-sensitive bicupin YhaK (pirin superfamily)|nr:pirin family protein [Bacteroidales bacterium]